MALDEAPNFSSRGNYPNGGEIVGPTWRWLWHHMADRKWRSRLDLMGCFWEIPVHPNRKTIDGLLRGAAKHGHLSTKSIDGRVHYRRKR